MSQPEARHLRSAVEQDVLVLTLAVTEVQDEKLADALRQELLAAVGDRKGQKVVIDFRQVVYISSVAFRPLLSLRRHMQAIGGRMILCGLSKIIGDIFYTTRLVSPTGSFDAPFEMAADVPSAIAKLRGETPSP
jgi:anti-sigma B factor antagonist